MGDVRNWWRRRFGDYARRERKALPDGTRVRLVCGPGCVGDHSGTWVTSWTPRRTGDLDDPDDYRLIREGDGETTFARRDAIEPIGRDGATAQRLRALHMVADVLRLLADKIQAVASGVGPRNDLENAATVLERQATVLREWIAITSKD